MCYPQKQYPLKSSDFEEKQEKLSIKQRFIHRERQIDRGTNKQKEKRQIRKQKKQRTRKEIKSRGINHLPLI